MYFVAKHGTLQKRIIDSISLLYNFKEIEDLKTEFSLSVFPFESNAFYIVIQHFKNTNFIKITSIVLLNKKIKKDIMELSQEQKNEVLQQFTDVYFEHKRGLSINEELVSLQSFSFLTIHNISMQRILDNLDDDVFLFTDIAKRLSIIDKSVKTDSVNNTHSMFQ